MIYAQCPTLIFPDPLLAKTIMGLVGSWCAKQTGRNERGYHSTPLVLEGAENIRVTSIDDGHSRHSEVLSASGTEIHAVTLVVVDGGLGEHSVILELRLSQGRTVVGDEDQLS